jgi:hypothetical protein
MEGLLIQFTSDRNGEDIITLACVLAMTSIGGKIAAYFTLLNSAMQKSPPSSPSVRRILSRLSGLAKID